MQEWAWSRRGWELMLYVSSATVGCFLVVRLGSPWIDAKALATASPALVLAGLVGGMVVFERGRRVEASLLIAAIAGIAATVQAIVQRMRASQSAGERS